MTDTRLVDTYNRRIDYLRISVTDRCNLRCVYCMPPQGIDLAESKDILRYEELLRVARIAAGNGVTKIRVTGGEPLVRKGILDFIKGLSEINGIEDISLTTNGVLLKEYAPRLKEAGLKRVNVSLDSLKRERFHKITRGDNLKDVLDGLTASQEAGLTPVKVNTVVIKGFNDDELTDFARISREKPYHMRFIEYMPFNTKEGWQREKCLSAREIKDLLSKDGELVPVESTKDTAGPARRFRYMDAPGEIGLISPVSEHFCGTCNRLRITADGKIRLCLFSDAEVDLKKSLRDGCSDDAVRDILFKAVHEKPERHHINENIFKRCSRTMSLIGG